MEQHEIKQGSLVYISRNARFIFQLFSSESDKTFHWIGTVWKIQEDKALVAVVLPGVNPEVDRRWYKLTDLTDVRDFQWTPNNERAYLEYLQFVGNEDDWEHPEAKRVHLPPALTLVNGKVKIG